MGRTRCDPFDAEEVCIAIEAGETTPLRAYEKYASTAARPYARSSWEVMLKQHRARAGRNINTFKSLHASGVDRNIDTFKPLNASETDQNIDTFKSLHTSSAKSDYWTRLSNVKPAYVLTTTSNNTRIAVRGSSLIITDDDTRLVYEKRGVKPLSIVLTGWGGYITIEAMRFCTDYKISIVILDWNREFMTVVLPASKHSVPLLRKQILADPLNIATTLIRAKVSNHAILNAINPSTLRQAQDRLSNATTIEHILIAEAQAARVEWYQRNIILQWREAGSIPNSWKLPYSTRRRMTGKNAKAATDPINALLNLSLAVTVGRLTVAIVARGLSPSIGFLHKSPRWALSYDAIEPLRPYVEDATFRFIERHQFSPTDFILVSDGQVKTDRELSRRFLDTTAVPQVAIDRTVDWLVSLISSSDRGHSSLSSCGLVVSPSI
jgi:CRISPR-associated endonuclease Cas1